MTQRDILKQILLGQVSKEELKSLLADNGVNGCAAVWIEEDGYRVEDVVYKTEAQMKAAIYPKKPFFLKIIRGNIPIFQDEKEAEKWLDVEPIFNNVKNETV
ncbi:hypothetical protein [Pontibacter sp. SGAir0037]|uniref:hypothetical protein n=1 Tax=Pontibacter sp. SGAir0037 TaxID=2571030 RepID=UPI0010CD603B|nr:hypothetical protein [Pontibacter sp. SGAir0037]QCR24753.1 hypothetical protein C1N53_21945 [Pontibacter sp. SGAir0037]